MEMPKNFSSVMLHHKMEEKGLDPQSLSKRSGVPLHQVYRYCRGDQKPRKGMIQRLSEALDTHPINFDSSFETDSIRLSYSKRSSKSQGRISSKYKNIKAVFFDLDGTLAKPRVGDQTSWELVWQYLGYDVDVCRKLHGKFNRDEISHEKWCEITAEHFRYRQLSRKSFKEIAKKAPLIDDVEPTLKKLKRKGIYLGLLSGSINSYLDEVLPNYRDYFDEVYINQFLYSNHGNGYIESINGAQYDFEGKADRLREYSEENRIPMHQIMFVGNSSNDLEAAKTGVISVGLNPNRVDSSTFKEVFDGEKSLSVILDLLE